MTEVTPAPEPFFNAILKRDNEFIIEHAVKYRRTFSHIKPFIGLCGLHASVACRDSIGVNLLVLYDWNLLTKSKLKFKDASHKTLKLCPGQDALHIAISRGYFDIA